MEFKGLTNSEVNERIEKGQVNYTEKKIFKSTKEIILEHTLTYFNFINIILGLVVIYSGYYKNLTFLGVIFSNTVISIFQELQVKKVIDQLEVVTVKMVKTIRDGVLKEIAVDKLVKDDVIFVENGNQIGTDCKVLSSQGLELNESLLTGESEPIKKKVEDEILAGSFVVAGSGYAQVIRVGKENYVSTLVDKAKSKRRASSEMKTSIEKIIKVLSVAIVPIGLCLFYAQVNFASQGINEAIVHTVAGVVGMIPEGLVLLTSVTFILGVGKLARKNALVQEMEAIEALARVDVLCLDKTGTITTGDLVVDTIDCLNDYSIDRVTDIMGGIAHAFDDVNVTQKALIDYFEKKEYKVNGLIPFSSKRKYRAIEFDGEGKFVLGAPEYLTSNSEYLDKVNEYSQKGCRVLLLGKAETMDEDTGEVSGIEEMALITIKDCIRSDAREILKFFRKQNVDIKILSGDNPVTVSKVALDAGVEGAEHFIDANDLPEDHDALLEIVEENAIFGRIKPEQKQLIIKSLQDDGHVVGMVGDGVNDVLALKDADCGIAMASGSDAARQAAHIVLLDSDFGSMRNIVDEGRNIIANIERASTLYLNKTIYSALLSVAFVFLGSTYPFIPIQLTLISCLSIGVPSFFLALERNTLLDHEGFLVHVIKTALPTAVTIFIYVLFIRFFGTYIGWDSTLITTYYYLITSFVCFAVLWIVCLPLHPFRVAMNVILIAGYLGALLLFPEFFSVTPLLSDFRLIWIIPMCASSVPVIVGLKYLFHRIHSNYKNYRIFNSIQWK